MRSKQLGILLVVLSGLVGVLLGLGIAWIIQFPLHMFGATLVTLDNEVRLWLGLPTVLGATFVYASASIVSGRP